MADWTTVVSRAVRTIVRADAEHRSDRELLEQFAAHADQTAFSILVERHSPMVLGVCGRLLPQTQDAEDATQAVFVLLARKAKTTNWHASIANWLYTTARKVARNARLASQRRVRREGLAKVTETPSPLDAMTGRELLVTLDEELDKLPPRYREPLVLCYLEGLTRDEAASRLGVPEATLKSQLERGRKKLAAALTARGCTLSSLLLLTATAERASAAFVDSILTSVSGHPTEAVATLLQGATMNGILAKTNLLLLLGIGVVLVGLASVPLTSAQPQKGERPKQVEKKLDEPKVEVKENPPLSRIGSTNFRADAAIGDARYSGDGKRVVAYAGMKLYVWDAISGERLRTIDTKLDRLTDPELEIYGETEFAFAVHPKANRVAWAGKRDGKTVLQVWDFERGERLVECETALSTLKAIAWTPDGKLLIERSHHEKEGRLVARDASLKSIHAHKLPEQTFYNAKPLLPHPDGKQVLLWLSKEAIDVVEIATGTVLRQIAFKPSIPSDLGISPDGKTLMATGTSEMWLYDFATGEKLRELPVLRDGWEKYRPMFSNDNRTVYVWDHHPIAYEVETLKRKWKAFSPTYFGAGMRTRHLSPDGDTLLVTVGRAVVLFDTKTGVERDVSSSPTGPASIFWTPDGNKIFTRHDEYARNRTFIAWDVATGKRLYHVRPGDDFKGDEWKMSPDLHFLHGGKEFLVCLEKTASHETSAFKELLVYDTETGRMKRKLGEEIGEKFRWMRPVAANDDGSQVLLQAYAVSMGKETEYNTILWQPEKKASLGEWLCRGDRLTPPRHFGPYSLFLSRTVPEISEKEQPKPAPAKLRFYSRTDGKLVRQLESEFTSLDADRLQGRYLLTVGYNSAWKLSVNTWKYEPTTAQFHELWDITTGEKLRLFETPKHVDLVLGPGGNYLIRNADESGFEIYEPFVLKKTVLKVPTLRLASRFEFSADGKRVAASLADTTVPIWDTTPWMQRIENELRKQLPQDLSPLWDDLAKDVEAGWRAARLLGLADERTVALFAEKLAPRRAPEATLIARLIRDLDSIQFATREKAEKELRGLANQIETQLRQSLKANPSAEAKQRIEELLKGIESRRLSPEESREVRAVAVLKGFASKEAKELLAKWATGDPNAVLTKAASATPPASR